MLHATIVQTEDELQQISRLNHQNLRAHLSAEERSSEGFLSWNYPFELLLKMHLLAPSIIVKAGEQVVGYALTTLREAGAFHPELENMFQHISRVRYRGIPLFSWRFYCMGQICVHKDFRRQGLVPILYAHHRAVYSGRFDLLVTEISSANQRSMHAHLNTGFENIYTYSGEGEEWNVVVWDWENWTKAGKAKQAEKQ